MDHLLPGLGRLQRPAGLVVGGHLMIGYADVTVAARPVRTAQSGVGQAHVGTEHDDAETQQEGEERELWSARLLAKHLEQKAGADRAGTWVDARKLIKVRHSDLGPTVLWDESRAALPQLLEPEFRGIAVMTGLIASDEEGLQTTLGRNGSDYSAAILAALTDADELHIRSFVNDGLAG